MPRVAITIDTEYPEQPAVDPLGTFDRILAILAAERVRATFFAVGSWARAHPDRVRAVDSAGHLLGNHSYSHCNLKKMAPEGIIADLTECRGALAGIGIETRPWFRAPYGRMGTEGGPIYDAVRDAGYRHISWHAHGGDWDPERTVEQLVDKTLVQVRERWPEPAIVLFHSWPDRTPAALQRVLDSLGSDGAEFVTVSRQDA
jgi:peptidoglycan-N-acetylglucosamine deacetylase